MEALCNTMPPEEQPPSGQKRLTKRWILGQIALALILIALFAFQGLQAFHRHGVLFALFFLAAILGQISVILSRWRQFRALKNGAVIYVPDTTNASTVPSVVGILVGVLLTLAVIGASFAGIAIFYATGPHFHWWWLLVVVVLSLLWLYTFWCWQRILQKQPRPVPVEYPATMTDDVWPPPPVVNREPGE
jgi:hypothetical protein